MNSKKISTYKVDNGFVIAYGGSWCIGLYDSEHTAKYSLNFTDEKLKALQEEKNKTTSQITFEDLKTLEINNVQ